MDMSMSGIASATTTSSMASSTSSMSEMGDMDMGGGDCKISMLWNWYTIDACFLSSSWHVKSAGGFAGSCIGVILLVMVLEALRRVSKEYDAFLVRKRVPIANNEPQASDSDSNAKNTVNIGASPAAGPRKFKPNLLEQLTRATLHMLLFAVAYFIMLLAMYFNGYIIICIFIGAWLGAFVFGWDSMGLPGQGEEREITYCCG